MKKPGPSNKTRGTIIATDFPLPKGKRGQRRFLRELSKMSDNIDDVIRRTHPEFGR